jgi:hypothetical protein
MNNIDLFKYPRFPLSSETIDFMQSMSVLIAKLAGLGGSNYILSGCVETGNNVSSGVVVIAGEILPFASGTKTTYVVIEETKRSVTAESQVYADIYISRVCRFGTGVGQIEWATIRRVPDILSISDGLTELADAFTTHVENHRVAWDHVDDKPTTFPGAIIKTGSVFVGDVSTDKLVVVSFDDIDTTDYIVTGSLRSNGTSWNDDNDVYWQVRSLTKVSFSLLCREMAGNVQNLYFDYVLIKK